MSKEVVSRGTIKKYMYISELKVLEVRKSPTDVGYDLEPYLVNVNNMEETFQFSDGKFYIDERNHKLSNEAIEKTQEEIKGYEAEGKTEEEIKELIAGTGIDYIDRVEYIIEADGIVERVEKAIEAIA